MSSPAVRMVRAAKVARALGPGWLAFRAGYAVRRRAGLLKRRLPAGSWEDRPLAGFLLDAGLADPARYLANRRAAGPRFFFSPADRERFGQVLTRFDVEGEVPMPAAEDLLRGFLRYFSYARVEVGWPPDWHRNPFTQEVASADRHWSQIDDFASGDIKVIWEPSRFSFAYDLVRAYWRTGDERFAEGFWRAVENWRAANPPQLGPNWKCGQEITFRLMAWCFGLYGFLDSPSTTAERVAALAQMIAVSAQRIECNISYSLSQRNNHGISEAIGLWTVGLLFPELRDAARWHERGRRILERLAAELIYDDGSFVQHSTNYHRLMLHDYLWAVRLGDLNVQPLSKGLRDRLARSAGFLFQIQDAPTGRVPRYGHDDGARILPFDNCDYSDYRPILQAVRYLTAGSHLYQSGPWDEDLLWLFGAEAIDAPVSQIEQVDLAADAGGYYTLRSASGFAFTRCAEFRHRPSQADQLHVDVWWRGLNVALDPGTYSYNAPSGQDGSLASTSVHNTVSVDGLDQMDKVGRFLWVNWAKGSVRRQLRSQHGDLAYWEGHHDGYCRLPAPVDYARAIVRLGSEHWLVLDRLRSRGEHEYHLHWLLLDSDYRQSPDGRMVELATSEGAFRVQMGSVLGDAACSLARGGDGFEGQYAPHYQELRAALAYTLVQRSRDALLWTLLGPSACEVVAGPTGLTISSANWSASVELGAGDGPVAHAIHLRRLPDSSSIESLDTTLGRTR